MVFYHGTGNDFDEFKREMVTRGILSMGFYFAARPESAETYAKRSPFGPVDGSVMAVYLNIRNPSITHGADTLAEKAGNDGIFRISKNISLKGPGNKLDRDAVVVVFKPEQIKSAYGNSGAFGPSADITKSEPANIDVIADNDSVLMTKAIGMPPILRIELPEVL